MGHFSIARRGKNDIIRYLSSEKHKEAINIASPSTPLTNYFRHDKFCEKEADLAKSEGLWAFQTVLLNDCFNSMECTSKLIQKALIRNFRVAERNVKRL